MSPPDALDGLCLAAALARDPRADAALEGLEPSVRAAVAARLASRATLPRAGRADALARTARAVLPEIDADAALPAHAAALLSTDAPASVRDAWAVAARMRPGFVASPGLRATLRRLAAVPPPPAAVPPPDGAPVDP